MTVAFSPRDRRTKASVLRALETGRLSRRDSFADAPHCARLHPTVRETSARDPAFDQDDKVSVRMVSSRTAAPAEPRAFSSVAMRLYCGRCLARASGDSFSNTSSSSNELAIPPTPADLVAQDAESALGRERLAIRAIGGQGVEDVRSLQDASDEGNLVASQAIGITAAILALMMPADNGQHVAKGLQRGANALANRGMRLHQLAFVHVERPRLQQHAFGDGDFADIVNHAAAAEGDAIVLGQSQPLAKRHAISREAIAVAFGVRVLGLNAGGEGEDHGFGAFQLVGNALHAHQRLHPGEQLFLADGLIQKIVGAGFDSLDAVFHAAEAGDEHDGREARLGAVLGRAANGKTALAGHDHVDEGHIDGFLLQHRQRRRAIAHGEHAIAMRAQHHLQHVAGGLIIVGDENGSQGCVICGHGFLRLRAIGAPKIAFGQGREKREEGPYQYQSRNGTSQAMRFSGRGGNFRCRAQCCQAKYPGSCPASSRPNQRRGGRWRRPGEAAGPGRRRVRERQDRGIW